MRRECAYRFGWGVAMLAAWCVAQCYVPQIPAIAQDDAADLAQIRAQDEQLVKAFNAGQVDALAAMFLPKGELVDEEGNIYQGREEIKGLFAKYFAKYPGAKLKLEIESIRSLGPVAIEEGSRLMTTKDESAKARLRYVTVRAKTPTGWQIAAIREFNDEPPATPHDLLEPLAWLVGDWVNEGNDAVVNISYRWSKDQNFLLGDYRINRDGSEVMNSSQRIGWDPLAGKVRSWLFDSDGGYGEGQWTPVDGAWVIKSSAVLPDGQTGSATVTITPRGKDKYTLKGTDRIAGDGRENDFEFTVVRRAPAPTK